MKMKGFAANTAGAIPTGTYFDPANPGWGLCISPAQGGNAIAIGMFFHIGENKREWLFASGLPNDGVFPVYRTSASAFPSGNAQGGELAGNLILEWLGESLRVHFSWTGLDVSPPPPGIDATLIAL